MKAPVSWMREFAAVPADAARVASRLAACGFEVASVDGDVIDFEITANRPDCLSVYGLAREAATAFDVDAHAAGRAAGRGAAAGGAAARRDAGLDRRRRLRPVRAGGRRRAGRRRRRRWLADRLTAAGVRPINNIVDVTNYVMLEMGQPMHAFDVARLAGPEIRVRRARPGETLVTLDGQTRTLDETMLVIADHERAVALAGVMGGARDGGVGRPRRRIALESAWFLPASVRATSRKLGLKTEASARFERGADITAPVRALRRALALLEKIGAGHAGGRRSSTSTRGRPSRGASTLRRARIARLLGDAVPDRDVERILTHLGFRADAERRRVGRAKCRRSAWTSPREADLIEEVGRHWGFDRIPADVPGAAEPAAACRRRRRARPPAARASSAAPGCRRPATFTFIERAAAAPFLPDGEAPVAIANPLSEKFAVLRPSLLPGPARRARLQPPPRDGRRPAVRGGRGLPRHRRIAAVGLGADRARVRSTGAGTAARLDFFDAKGVAELVGQAFGVELTAEPADDAAVVRARPRGRRSPAHGDGQRIVVGADRPASASNSSPARGLVVADAVSAASSTSARSTRARRPAGNVAHHAAAAASRRSSAICRFSSTNACLPQKFVARFERTRRRRSCRCASSIGIRVRALPAGQISLSVRLTFRDPDRTLTDSEVQQAVDAIVAALSAELGATLRSK